MWDVDIINLSLVTGEHSGVRVALENAIMPKASSVFRKVVFASAGGNCGRLENVSWLAKSCGVIPVHATDGYGHPHGREPGEEGPRNSVGSFAFKIRVDEYFKTRKLPTYISGSSFATPIAAGIAASLMEIYHQDVIPSSWRSRYVPLLHGTKFIHSLLEEIGRYKGGHIFVQPWTFWDDSLRKSDDYEGNWMEPGSRDNIKEILKKFLRRQ